MSVLLFGLGGWLGCARLRPAGGSFDVEYAGCRQVRLPGPVCVLDKGRELRLWSGVPVTSSVEVRAGRDVFRPAGRPVGGGRLWVVKVPEETQAVELRTRGNEGSRTWSLRLGRGIDDPGREPFNEAMRKLWQGEHAAAQLLLRQAQRRHRELGLIGDEADDVVSLVHSLVQVRRFDEAREVLARFEIPAGAPAEAAYARSFARGLLAENLGDARTALADLADAAGVAERLGLTAKWYMAEQVRARQLRGLGRSREAGALFAALATVPSPEITACDRAQMRVNQAWALILAGEAGEVRPDPLPILEEAQAIALREKCGSLEDKRRNFHLNRTFALLQAGRAREARRDLAAYLALAGEAPPLYQLWSLDLEARLDLAERKPEAARGRYDRLAELAEQWSLPEGVWRAAFGRATCFEALGQVEEALAEYRRAESLVDRESLSIPVQGGRETFLAQRRAATDRQIELLLGLERAPEALAVVRRERSRVLRELARADRLAHLSPAERKTWSDRLARYQGVREAVDDAVRSDRRLPADERRQNEGVRLAQLAEAERALDEALSLLGRIGSGADLPPFRPGELVLAYRPLGTRWVGFAADERGAQAARIDLPPSAPGVLAQPDPKRNALLAQRLLVPFAARIERSRQVRVLPMGELRQVDFHALPFGGPGRILLDQVPVVYGLDLAPAPPSSHAPPVGGPVGPLRALVVGDPRNDLPAAAEEAVAVGRALAREWSVEPLRRKAATRDAVLRALVRADHFHYAGHGEVAGRGGWESELPLAGGTRLTLGDLLALGRAPARVVLSGCETGSSGSEAPVEGVGLAQAFLLAGSEAVIASTRKVDDARTRALFADLYLDWGPSADPAERLRQAQLAARRRQMPERDWASFRIFAP